MLGLRAAPLRAALLGGAGRPAAARGARAGRPACAGPGRTPRPAGARAAASAAAARGGPAGAPGGGAAPAAAKQRPAAPAGLVGLTGAPIRTRQAADDPAGVEVELTAQNVQQVLSSPGALLLLVGALPEGASKKVGKLRVAAGGALPLVRLSCALLPQICQALKIVSEPCLLLMAQGQVAAALEGDLSPQAATAFVERTAQMLRLKVDLGGEVGEQLAEAEEDEWASPAAAAEVFAAAADAADAPLDVRVRAAAGRARCLLRLEAGRAAAGGEEDPRAADEARAVVAQLESSGHGRAAEAKQAAAMLRLHDKFATPLAAAGGPPLEALAARAAEDPKDVEAVSAYANALFWAGRETEAVDAGLALLRKKRSDEVKELVLCLVEALGPRHPEAARARKRFSSAMFV